MRCEQLDLLLQWGAEFRRATSQSAGQEKGMEDQVAFDVILGDMNFDNCSSGKFTAGKYALRFLFLIIPHPISSTLLLALINSHLERGNPSEVPFSSDSTDRKSYGSPGRQVVK